jgi:hypothetical protein
MRPSTLLNLILLAGLPFLAYAWWQKRRHERPCAESARPAGHTLGKARYLGYCLGATLIVVLALALIPQPLEPFLRPGSPQRDFAGLRLCWPAVPLALSYVLKTGLAEESIFRGLITGSLERRLGTLGKSGAVCHLPPATPAGAPVDAGDGGYHFTGARRSALHGPGKNPFRLYPPTMTDPRLRKRHDVPERRPSDRHVSGSTLRTCPGHGSGV